MRDAKDILILNYILLNFCIFLIYWAIVSSALTAFLITLGIIAMTALILFGYSRLSERLQDVVFDAGGRIYFAFSIIALAVVLIPVLIRVVAAIGPNSLRFLVVAGCILLLCIALSSLLD